MWDAPRSLDVHTNWGAGLKEAYRCVGRIGRLVGIEPEVVQCAEANRIGVLVLRKRFACSR